MVSSDDVSRFAADAEILFHQHVNDAAVIDSQTLQSISASTFAGSKQLLLSSVESFTRCIISARCVPWNESSRCCHDVRPSVCPGRTCIVTIQSLLTWHLYFQSLFSSFTWKRNGVLICKLGVKSQEQLKIEVNLLFSANRKSYMPRRFAQLRMTLSDLEWSFYPHCTISLWYSWTSCYIYMSPLPSIRQHPSYEDCLEDLPSIPCTSCDLTTRCLAVTGDGSVDEYGTLNQSSWLFGAQ